MSSVVHVSGISSQTGEKDIRDFFSFCGKISDLKIEDSSEGKEAKVTFEKETAAKTALLLDSTQLGPSQIKVTSGSSTGTSTSKGVEESHDDEVSQDEKPRSRIFAEYLAHGYVISDKAIEQALALDQKHGVSQRFMSSLQGFDSKYKVTDKSRDLDSKYAVSSRANNAWSGLASYFDQAANTPTGQKLRSFYEQGSKQVLDVHNEARHLANLKSGKPTGTGSSGQVPSAEEAEMEKVPGTEKTKCNCGAESGKCPCEPGKCACADCSKNTGGVSVPSTKT